MLSRLSPTSLGVLLGLFSYASYSTGDALVKGLGANLGVFEIGFFTTLFSIIPAALSKPKAERWRDTFRLNNPMMVHAIALVRTASAVMATYALVSIPLAEAYCIIFLLPVLITILSVIMLREQVSLDRWALAVVSFLGVLVVVRPGFQVLQLGHLAALGCAIAAAASVVMMRMISGREKRTSLFVLPGLYTLAVNGVMLLFGFATPDWLTLGALALCGVLGGVGYLLQIAALSIAPASRVAPMQYSQLIWGLLYGALFFGELPDAFGFVGLGIVLVAGLANVFADGARARIAGRWAEYRGRRNSTGPTGLKGPGPDPV